MSHVAAMSAPLDEADAQAAPATGNAEMTQLPPEPEPKAVVLPFEPVRESPDAAQAAQSDATPPSPSPDSTDPDPITSEERADDEAPAEDTGANAPVEAGAEAEAEAEAEEVLLDEQTDSSKKTQTVAISHDGAPPASDEQNDAPHTPDAPSQQPAERAMSPLPEFLRAEPQETSDSALTNTDADPASAPPVRQDGPRPPAAEAPAESDTAPTDPMVAAGPPNSDNSEQEPVDAAPEKPKKPRDIGMPDVQTEAEIHASPAVLSALTRARGIDAETAQKLHPLLSQLAALRDRMNARGGPAKPNH